MSKKRNFRKEYDSYQGKPEQIKRRAARNRARYAAIKAGKARKGDGKDVHHKNGNPHDNRASNLKVISKSKNRGFKRSAKGKNLGLRKGKK